MILYAHSLILKRYRAFFSLVSSSSEQHPSCLIQWTKGDTAGEKKTGKKEEQ
jgi:hypothetical protein